MLDERQRLVGNRSPAAVDHLRVPTIWNLDDLRDASPRSTSASSCSVIDAGLLERDVGEPAVMEDAPCGTGPL
jgi:hypothetical protein